MSSWVHPYLISLKLLLHLQTHPFSSIFLLHKMNKRYLCIPVFFLYLSCFPGSPNLPKKSKLYLNIDISLPMISTWINNLWHFLSMKHFERKKSVSICYFIMDFSFPGVSLLWFVFYWNYFCIFSTFFCLYLRVINSGWHL